MNPSTVIGSGREQKKISNNLGHNILELYNALLFS